MAERRAMLGTVGAIVFAVGAVVTFVRGQYMFAGTSLLFLSFSLYLRETANSAGGGESSTHRF